MQASKTIRRDALMRRIAEGKLIGKVDYHYTDDYAFDAAVNFRKSDWLEINLIETGKDFINGKLNLYFSDFSGYGSAWINADGLISLFFGYKSYSLRFKDEKDIPAGWRIQ